MVDVVGRAKVIIEGDVDSRSIDSAGGKIGSSLRKGAIIGVAALGTLAAAGVKVVHAYEDAESQSRKLTQVLDNMGKSSAAPAVENLAESLRKLTGVDDEVIKGGQTILATFSQVAKSAGQVGGTFERATKLSLDLAAAGFGDVNSASVQLGKALQDPIKGMTALSRSGITFTEDQKKVIKSFVDAGEAGKAQNLILKEIEKQVGGTAEASATQSKKISSAWGEVEEAAGHLISKLDGGNGDSLSDALNTVADNVNKAADSDGWDKFTHNAAALGDTLQDSRYVKLWATVGDAVAEGLGEAVGWLAKVTGSLDEAGDSAEVAAAKLSRMFVLSTLPDKIGAAFSKLPLKVQLDFSTNVPDTIEEVAKLAGSIKNVKPAQIQAILDASGVDATLAEVQGAIAQQQIMPLDADPTKLQATLAEQQIIVSETEAQLLLDGDDATFQEVLARAIADANDAHPTPKLGLDDSEARAKLGKFIQDALAKLVANLSLNFPGVTTSAGGQRNFAGGLSWVGEEGPELMYVPKGADIYTNTESQQMVAAGAGVTINQVFNGPTTGSGRLQEIDWTLRYAPRQGVA